MPFRLRLGKRSQQYNVANKDLFVIPIEILTNEPIECTLLATSIGRECLNNVCQRLNIQQSEYFGLLFKSKRGIHQWVDLSKPLKKQLDKYSLESRLYLRLQYFVPNLHFLSDEVSRYHYFCSMKLLVIEGRLECDRDEAVLLASFSLQAEFGDFNPERHTAEYLNNFALFPHSMISNNKVAQDLHMECVINAYRKLQGVPPNVAEIYYISEAQQLDGIGQEGFPAKDNDTGADVCLGVTLKGIFVVHTNSHKQEIFRWTDIANLIHQKKVFTIERNPDGLRKNYSTFDSDYASCVWKTCVEQHQYFMKGLRNSVDTDSQQSDQSKQEVSHLNNNINGTNNLHQNHQNITPISNGADITAHNISKGSASTLPQTIQTIDHYNESVNQNINTDRFERRHNREYSAPNQRELTTDSIVRHIYNSSDNTYRNRSSTETTDLHQIHVSFVDNNDIPIQQTIDGHNSVSNLSNITTVQVHHQPSWAATEQSQSESDPNYEQRRQLLPPYKPPPDYESFMRQKYGNLSVSVGNIGACIASSHPMANNYSRNGFVISSTSTSASSIRHFCPQQPYAQYKNYSDLSNLEIDQTGLNNKCGVRSSLPPTQNWLPSEHPLISSPLRIQQLTSGIITCSTPELNSLNIANNEIKLEDKCSHIANNHHLLYLINNQRLPPPYGFNSVPDLSCQPIVRSQNIQNAIEPMAAVSENTSRAQQTSGSEPNIANIPLMTAYSTKINPMPQHLNSSNIMQSSVDKLLQSHTLHISNTSQTANHLSQSSNIQNVYNLSQLSQRQKPSVMNSHTNHTPEAISPRILTTQMSTNSSQNMTNNLENRNSNGNDITSTIGSYLVKKSDNKIEPIVDKDRRVFALEETLNDSEFMREFDLLPRMNPTAKFTTALIPENIYRNRFRDILPYEDNRVKLTPTKENKSGYINASHVVMNLGNTRQHYIASQGPLVNTAPDFWQMVFEQSVNLIVMVTDFNESNQQKCFEYLPLTHDSPHNVLKFGDYEVVCKSTSMSMTFITSTLLVTFNGQKRNITHLRFTEWSDHSCPDDVHGFLSFLSEMDAIYRRSSREGSGFGRNHKRNQIIAPILVHCSAGVGRSGVVILCDSLLKFLDYNSTEMLDVPKALTQLRFQRMLSVQHCQQFRFVCKVLAQYLANSRLI